MASAHPAPLVPGQEGAGCDWPLRGHLLVQEPLLLPLPRRSRRTAELRKYEMLTSEFNVGFLGAFTQMVWAASQTFGCGKARSSNGKVIVVAYYYPKGNIPDKYHLNVVQPRETLEH